MKLQLICEQCRQPFQLKTPQEITYFLRKGRRFCSKSCASSHRMTTCNPMWTSVSRQRMTQTMRDISRGPAVRGGNGKGPTLPQRELAAKMGQAWEMELVIGLGNQWRLLNCPKNYRVDIGNRLLKRAVEVDGSSHLSLNRRIADQKKDRILSSLGWSVARLTNEEVMRLLKESARVDWSTICRFLRQKSSLQTA